MSKTKTKPKIVFIKITHNSLMGNLFSGSSFDAQEGDVVRAIHITKEIRERIVADGKPDPGVGYLTVQDRGFVSEAFVSTDISQKDFDDYATKLGSDIDKREEERDKLDKVIAYLKNEYEELICQKLATMKQ